MTRETTPLAVALFATTLVGVIVLASNTQRLPAGFPTLLITPIVASAALVFRSHGTALQRLLHHEPQRYLALSIGVALWTAGLVALGEAITWQDIDAVTFDLCLGRSTPAVRTLCEWFVFAGTLVMSAVFAILQFLIRSDAAIER